MGASESLHGRPVTHVLTVLSSLTTQLLHMIVAFAAAVVIAGRRVPAAPAHRRWRHCRNVRSVRATMLAGRGWIVLLLFFFVTSSAAVAVACRRARRAHWIAGREGLAT